MTARSGWAEAQKNSQLDSHDLKVVAICFRSKTGFSRTISTLILTLNFFCASAQEYKFKAIAEKFRDGKFDKSLKLAEASICI
jgi:hypothetical protein